jgi:prevent-host-death family protein
MEAHGMKTISAVEARRNLGEFLNIVALTGEEITIERAGRKIARLVGCGNAVRRRAPARERKLDFRKAAGLGADLWRDLDVDAYVATERDQWN